MQAHHFGVVLTGHLRCGCAGYVMLLWFWGSKRKRAFFARTRKQLASFLKACSHLQTSRASLWAGCVARNMSTVSL